MMPKKGDHALCHRDIDRLLTQVGILQNALKQVHELASWALAMTIEQATQPDGTTDAPGA
jgi:hypothetical protein